MQCEHDIDQVQLEIEQTLIRTLVYRILVFAESITIWEVGVQ
jgi:hypothetical protein